MKKLIKMILCCFMSICLFACSSKQEVIDDKQVVIDALKKTNELEFVDLDMDMSMKFMGMTIDVPINSKMISKDNKATAMSMSTSVMGQDIEMSYIDGYIYMSVAGMKFKGSATEEEFIEYSEMNYSLDESMILDAKKMEDGSYNVVLNNDAANDLTGSLEGSLGEMENNEIKNMTYNVKINKDGYVSDFSIIMDLSAVIEATSYDINATINCKYNNIGQTFEITVPEDADSYEEVDISELMNSL